MSISSRSITGVNAAASGTSYDDSALVSRITALEARATEMESFVTVAKTKPVHVITLATVPQYNIEYSDTAIPATRSPLTATLVLATNQVTFSGFLTKLSNGSSVGLPSGSGNPGEVIFTLPPGFRIGTEQVFNVGAYTNATPGASDLPDRTAKVIIRTDGPVYFDGIGTYMEFNYTNGTSGVAHGIRALDFDLTFDR